MTQRVVLALLLAGAVGAVVIFAVASGARAHEHHTAQLLEARAEAAMLADLASRTAADEVLLQQIVDRFNAESPHIEAVRVVRGRRLEASTAPEDQGERQAPRRLAREEKPLFDRAQLLRAAVENNQLPENPDKDEVIVERIDSGGFTISLPIDDLEAGRGSVSGMVELTTRPLQDPPPMPRWWLLLLITALALAGGGVSWLIPERRWIVVGSATILLLLVLALVTRLTWGPLAAEVEATTQGLTEAIAAAEQLAREALDTVSTEPYAMARPIDGSAWDIDDLRASRGLIGPGPVVITQGLEQQLAERHTLLRRVSIASAGLAIAIFLFFGLGYARRVWSTLARHREAYAYTVPALLAMLVLVFFPFIYGIGLSFTNQNVYNINEPLWEIWIGVDNFVEIISDLDMVERTDSGLEINYNNFYWTLGFTIVWTVTNVTLGVSVGLMLALVLNTPGLRFRPLYRVLLILPWAVPNYITALIWKGMFHSQYGVINQVVQMLGGESIAWFEQPATSFLTVLATNGWLSFPFMMVICLGALQSIPSDLYEAARVDGATRWQQFISITLPSLKPALIPAVIISVVWTFNMFNIIYLVSQGEPAGATEILVTEAYKLAFEQYRYGYAAAYSTVIFGILLIYGLWQNRVTQATEGI